jgi:hypothetical protein
MYKSKYAEKHPHVSVKRRSLMQLIGAHGYEPPVCAFCKSNSYPRELTNAPMKFLKMLSNEWYKECPFGCGMTFQAEMMALHKNVCALRPVRCPILYCGNKREDSVLDVLDRLTNVAINAVHVDDVPNACEHHTPVADSQLLQHLKVQLPCVSNDRKFRQIVPRQKENINNLVLTEPATAHIHAHTINLGWMAEPGTFRPRKFSPHHPHLEIGMRTWSWIAEFSTDEHILIQCALEPTKGENAEVRKLFAYAIDMKNDQNSRFIISIALSPPCIPNGIEVFQHRRQFWTVGREQPNLADVLSDPILSSSANATYRRRHLMAMCANLDCNDDGLVGDGIKRKSTDTYPHLCRSHIARYVHNATGEEGPGVTLADGKEVLYFRVAVQIAREKDWKTGYEFPIMDSPQWNRIFFRSIWSTSVNHQFMESAARIVDDLTIKTLHESAKNLRIVHARSDDSGINIEAPGTSAD